MAHHHQPAMASIGRSEDEYITIRQKIDDNMQALTGAFLTWSYSIVQIFYAYRALQRTEHAQAQARIVFGCG